MSVDLAPSGPRAAAAPGPEQMRRVMRRHAAGVTVITLPGPAGFTASSFTSVSLDPPLVSFCLGLTSSSAARLRVGAPFAVHLLGAEHAELARRFARRGTDRFSGLRWVPGEGGVPLIEDAGARIEAEVVLLREVGDHVLAVGRVVRTGGRPGLSALVHHDGAFASATPLD